ncbi:type B 50S ribosomal protein L31 [Kitasatospora sp. YST-16]|uniref:type B 50S ribosomal protein L31 n=1 Tax=Kitasatospora sp. YST-16 TaxID=2998080 RepID=UPI00228330BB|nr:type B 50S ribosomal protein L31 [Kitasatospora sp. YST-16]WAL70766.1 type B 50S ribosomal protein L31 [Kitasatospora sp. YST-16]WNW36804.1 type B 50S ribosomal protein L31 [Streptomyces sp. Li-HN-5-13]
MQQGIHPEYRPVVFRDKTGGLSFLTLPQPSAGGAPFTAWSDRTVAWADGRTYPVVDVETSSASHPFYTGRARLMDTEGRVELYRRRYGG